MTSPIDYFARDTISRALGPRVVPEFPGWKVASFYGHPPNSSYMYRIAMTGQYIIHAGQGEFAGSYYVLWLPDGAASKFQYLNEHGDDSQLPIPLPYGAEGERLIPHFESATVAAEVANLHAVQHVRPW